MVSRLFVGVAYCKAHNGIRQSSFKISPNSLKLYKNDGLESEERRGLSLVWEKRGL